MNNKSILNNTRFFISKLITLYHLDNEAKKKNVADLRWKLEAAINEQERSEKKLKDAREAQLNKNLTEDEFANL